MLPGRMTWLELQHKVMMARLRQHRVTIDSQQWAQQAHQAQQAKQAQQAQHAQQAQILHKLTMYTDSPIESKLNTNWTQIEHANSEIERKLTMY